MPVRDPDLTVRQVRERAGAAPALSALVAERGLTVRVGLVVSMYGTVQTEADGRPWST